MSFAVRVSRPQTPRHTVQSSYEQWGREQAVLERDRARSLHVWQHTREDMTQSACTTSVSASSHCALLSAARGESEPGRQVSAPVQTSNQEQKQLKKACEASEPWNGIASWGYEGSGDGAHELVHLWVVRVMPLGPEAQADKCLV